MKSPFFYEDSREFWENKSVLITGHTGFKGGWLTIWLEMLGARVCGLSLPPISSPNIFETTGVGDLCESHFCDIRDRANIIKLVHRLEPEIVFHLAAQPLVRESYRSPVETFSTNVMGTVNLLDALRDADRLKSAVIVTTDKVYLNNEWHWPYRENDQLGGHDPYSASKAASELAIDCYAKAFFSERNVGVVSARAGNVIGGGDWSEDRLIPDAIRSWETGKLLSVRRPYAIRPWQHVLEPLAGYMRLAEAVYANPSISGAFNFGPDNRESMTVKEIIVLARNEFGRGTTEFLEGLHGPHEAGRLELETGKSRALLGHRSRWTTEEAVSRTMQWYRDYYEGRDALQLCHADIVAYKATV